MIPVNLEMSSTYFICSLSNIWFHLIQSGFFSQWNLRGALLLTDMIAHNISIIPVTSYHVKDF